MNQQQQKLQSVVASSIGPAADRLQAVRVLLLEKLWRGMMLVAIIATPVSILRAQSTGWLQLYSIQAALGSLIVLLYLIRDRFSYR